MPSFYWWSITPFLVSLQIIKDSKNMIIVLMASLVLRSLKVKAEGKNQDWTVVKERKKNPKNAWICLNVVQNCLKNALFKMQNDQNGGVNGRLPLTTLYHVTFWSITHEENTKCKAYMCTITFWIKLVPTKTQRGHYIFYNVFSGSP